MIFALAPFSRVRANAQTGAMRIESFTLRPGGEVRIDNSRGSTRVESWGSNTVRVVAEKKSQSGSGIEPSELVMMGAGNKLIIECRAPSIPARLDLTLYVPRDCEIAVTGGAFAVEVSGALIGATIDTTSGQIDYHVPTSDDASIEARSLRGTVRSTVPMTGVERTGTQSLRGQLGNGEALIILNSESGNISLVPGPNSTRVARASRGGNPQDQTSSGANNQTAATADPDKPADITAGNSHRSLPRRDATQNSGAGGSIDLAGSDRGDDGGYKSRTGPLERERHERSTTGGNSGIRTRIIPADAPPRQANPQATPDDNDSDVQQQQSSQSQRSRSGRPNPPDPTISSGGSGAVFAGSDVGDDSGSRYKAGPFERDRRSRDTTGGNAGLRVRIIPSTQALGSRDSDNTIYPSRDRGSSPPQADDAPIPSDADANNDARANNNAPRTRRNDLPSSADDSIWREPASSRRGAPPVLQRQGNDSDAPAPSPAAARASSDPEEEAITLKAALVNMNVSVTNRQGLALGGLKKEDFQIAENGAPQRIEFFAPTTAPFNLVLLIDLSGSIKDKLDVIKSAALKFLDVIGPQDKVAVVSFTDDIRVISQLTNDRDELKRRIKSMERAQGGTAFYEAMWFALVDTLRGTAGQRNAIVVLSDGVDSSMDRYNPLDSRVSFPQLARRLEEADVIAFPIYFDTEYEEVFERGNSSSEAYAIARDQLEQVAEISGGQMYRAEKASDISGVYKQVAAAIRTVYSIGYQPTNPEKDGTFRKIRVSVNRADAAVRTRKGYYAR
jgi:VWFA-related protein